MGPFCPWTTHTSDIYLYQLYTKDSLWSSGNLMTQGLQLVRSFSKFWEKPYQCVHNIMLLCNVPKKDSFITIDQELNFYHFSFPSSQLLSCQVLLEGSEAILAFGRAEDDFECTFSLGFGDDVYLVRSNFRYSYCWPCLCWLMLNTKQKILSHNAWHCKKVLNGAGKCSK